ncbi:uncharacterized protein RAG0_03071 [Rhynchosporium agropyri]|uniref:Uncharacterized protein n=1 Tax=Rhynchosporium agropyri TaxID=914238 RepID=A0A1E1K348_9HELO|nr:uncharacterized protein RAG0_03071 [Rhynchosporium agropyri]
MVQILNDLSETDVPKDFEAGTKFGHSMRMLNMPNTVHIQPTITCPLHICRTNTGVIQELLDLKKHDEKDTIPWVTVYCYTTFDGLVSQVGWKDQAFVLMMSTLFSGHESKRERLRKRLKETSSKAKTSREPFKGQPQAWLYIPKIADCYNYRMSAVDDFDHLIAQNAGLRHIERGRLFPDFFMRLPDNE